MSGVEPEINALQALSAYPVTPPGAHLEIQMSVGSSLMMN